MRSTTQTLTQPAAALSATSSKTDVNCFGGTTGSVSATPAGGTSPYAYVIAGPTVNTTGASSGVFTGLAAGSYTITITDAKGCTTTTTQTLAQPAAALTATSIKTDVNCFGGTTGSVSATPSGGTSPYSYVIAGPTVNTTGASSGVFTALAAGSYTITVTDAKGCTTTTTQTLAQPAAALSATSSKSTEKSSSHTNDSVSATASGGTSPYAYVIAGPTVNTTGASSGV